MLLFLRRPSRHKIDLTQSYPCPNCQQGELRLIALTEALGCNRCQHIFAITPDQTHAEQLAVSHPHQKVWYWNGSEWILERESSPMVTLLWGIAAITIVLLVLISLFLAVLILGSS